MGAHKDWWVDFLKRNHFPEYGHYLIVPDDDPKFVRLVHGESMQGVDVQLDPGESLEDCAKFFQTVFPNAQVAAPYTQKTP